MSICVYIDGACTNNGKENAKAGYGVYFSEDDSRNDYGRVIGKQSNNTGELTACIRSMEILENEIKEKKEIDIYTDSEYVMKCVTTYGDKLEKNDWKLSTGKTPPNLELLKKAHGLFKKARNIKIHHIDAHTNKTDIHSIGNSHADRLANLAIGIIDKKDTDIRVEINFNDKDEAKKLGAKWNVDKKYWYYTTNISEENKEKLEELAKKKYDTVSVSKPASDVHKKYVKVPFSKKDMAKKLGAKWDVAVKSWYYTDDTVTSDNISKLLALQ